MNNVHFGYKALSVVTLILAFAALAQAAPAFPQIPRTWVSGVGDDANPCTRTAPCKTFAVAITLTLAGGEIDALDPGDYGTVTIQHSITIDGTQGNGFASINSGSLNDGISVSAAATDNVTIRNISINGGAGANFTHGIRILSAKTVHIENCVISNTAASGIIDNHSGNVNDVFYLYIKNTIIRNTGGDGVAIIPAPAGSVFVIATFSNVDSYDNAARGVEIQAGGYVSLDHCNLSGNISDGLWVFGNSGGTEGSGAAASAHVDNTISSNNGNPTGAGFHAGDGGFIRLANSTAYDNTTGLQIDAGGKIFSYVSNRISGNTNGNGPPSGTIPVQ
jgi:hypothetical protein